VVSEVKNCHDLQITLRPGTAQNIKPR